MGGGGILVLVGLHLVNVCAWTADSADNSTVAEMALENMFYLVFLLI